MTKLYELREKVEGGRGRGETENFKIKTSSIISQCMTDISMIPT